MLTSAAGSGVRAGEEWHTAWNAALDEFELDIDLVESQLRSAQPDLPPSSVTWTPPANLGPLPGDLMSRAAAILDRQLQTAEELARRMVDNRRQVELSAKLTSREAAKPPVYLDTAV
jgi:hypothetical protein